MYYYHLYLSLYSLEPTDLPPTIFDPSLPLPLTKQETLDHLNTHYHRLEHVGSYRLSTTTTTTTTTENSTTTAHVEKRDNQPQNTKGLPSLNELEISDCEKNNDDTVNNVTTTATTRKPLNDFRFGPIDMECIDRIQPQQLQSTQQHSLGYGIIHFYRDKQPAPDDLMPDMLAVIPHPDDIGTITCTLAVPSSMTTIDFLTFVKPFDDTVLQYRFIRDVAPNKYMVLMKFKDVQSAYHYHRKFNGRSYHSMEPEICHIVFLGSVTWIAHGQSSFPMLKDTLQMEREQQLPCHTIELPTCPVCLERLDKSVTGLMGITCQHSFDCGCLGKWGDGNCHTCRFSEKPVLEGIRRDVVMTQTTTTNTSMDRNYSGPRRNQQGWLLSRHANDDRLCCYVCGEIDRLWICMICGHIGCGRYQEAHAYDHYMETRHLFALEIDTQRVWDYEGDGYVHRLIQNTVDGKLLEFPGITTSLTSYPDGLLEKDHLPESSSYSNRQLGDGQQHGNSGTRLDGWHGYGVSSNIAPTPTAAATPSAMNTIPSSSSSNSSTQMIKPSLSPHTSKATAAVASSAGSSLIKYKYQGGEGSDDYESRLQPQDNKLEAMSIEYTTLLTSQLESQRIYYEDQLDALTRQLDSLSAQKSDLKNQRYQAAEHHHRLVLQSSLVQHDTDTLERTQSLLRDKSETWKEQYEEGRRKWEEEKKMTTALSDNNAMLKTSLEEKQRMLVDLNDELRDLAFFVEARNKIQQQMPDMVGGSVGTTQRAPTRMARRGRKGKKG